MRSLLSALFFILFTLSAAAQTIQYEKTYTEALQKAAAEKKPLFLVLNIPPNPARPIKTGLDLPEVAAKYNDAFVCLNMYITDTAYTSLRAKYPWTILPAYFFIDGYGSPIYKDNRNSFTAEKYLAMADSTLNKIRLGTTLTDYDLRYRMGGADFSFLKEYITAREKMGVYDNAILIENYVDKLPIDQQDNYQEMLFIFNAGPIYLSNAYKMAYHNRKIIDSIFKTEPSAVRSAFNTRIKANTYKQAVAKKDETLANELSRFIRNINRSSGYRNAGREAEKSMVSFYKDVNDTTDYLRSAAFFYDSYYMTISTDSVKKLQAIRARSINNTLQRIQPVADTLGKPQIKAVAVTITDQVISAVSSPSEVSTILNNAANDIYQTGTKNQRYIYRAKAWIQHAIELDPGRPNYYDTLAHLLYRSGQYQDAEYNEELAIDMATKERRERDMVHIKEELVKMQRRKL